MSEERKENIQTGNPLGEASVAIQASVNIHCQKAAYQAVSDSRQGCD